MTYAILIEYAPQLDRVQGISQLRHICEQRKKNFLFCCSTATSSLTTADDDDIDYVGGTTYARHDAIKIKTTTTKIDIEIAESYLDILM